MIKFALIKERKSPPDKRVIFTPEKLKEVVKKFPEAHFIVESSDVRIFSDVEYREAGFEVTEDISDCDVMLGVKEVPVHHLIPKKKYFFFSHTIKKQPYNRDLLREILKKGIELYDHEVIIAENGQRLIGFGRYAGLVGTYNAFRAFGLKERLYDLPRVSDLRDLDTLLAELDKIQVPSLKIVLTGSGKVARGAKEIMDHLKIKQVKVEEYLNENFKVPVYCLIDVLDYNKRLDGRIINNYDFYEHPEEYTSDFLKFAKVSDVFIAGHFYGEGAPVFFSKEDAQSPDFKLRYIADVSCDIKVPIPSTIRPSTVAEPFYGYDPSTGNEVDLNQENAITVMAVDNLPCELPRNASEGFGEMFMQHVMPAFFNDDRDGILERARMTQNGKLTERFSYLKDFAEGKEISV